MTEELLLSVLLELDELTDEEDVFDAAVELDELELALLELLLESMSSPVSRLSVFFRMPSVPNCHTSR